MKSQKKRKTTGKKKKKRRKKSQEKERRRLGKVQERKERKKEKEKEKSMGLRPVDLLTKAQIHFSPSAKDTHTGPGPTLLHQTTWASLFTIHLPNPIWAPEESKSQLLWAPATSKDGFDYDPPSQFRYS